MTPFEKFVFTVAAQLQKKGWKPTNGYESFARNTIQYLTCRKDVEFSAEFGNVLSSLGLELGKSTP